MKLTMPKNKYCYVISDQFENIIGAATTMKKALGMVEEEDMDEVEVSSEWQESSHIHRHELSNNWFIDKISLNQI